MTPNLSISGIRVASKIYVPQQTTAISSYQVLAPISNHKTLLFSRICTRRWMMLLWTEEKIMDTSYPDIHFSLRTILSLLPLLGMIVVGQISDKRWQYRFIIFQNNIVPTMQFFTGIPRNTQSKLYMLSLTECVPNLQNSALWDTHKHALL